MASQIDCSKTGNLQCLISQSNQIALGKHDTIALQWEHKGDPAFVTPGLGETGGFLWETQGFLWKI